MFQIQNRQGTGPMDFVSAWKAVSIVMTGAFGVLGLIKDFKDKDTGKVTGWGRVSLAGIILSSSLGVAAQLKETSDQEKTRVDAAKQTFALLQNTAQAIKGIQRTLSPLTEPVISLDFDTPCSNEMYKPICERVKSTSIHFPLPRGEVFEGLPKLPANIKLKSLIRFYFFQQQKQTDELIKTIRKQPGSEPQSDGVLVGVLWNIDSDLEMECEFALDDENQAVVYPSYTQGDNVRLVLNGTPRFKHNKGTISSILDLRETTIVMFTDKKDWALLDLSMAFKSGQRFSITANKMERIDTLVYRYVYPREFDSGDWEFFGSRFH